MELNIAIFEFDIQWLDRENNLSIIKNYLETISADIDLVILPEMFLSGFCMDPEKAVIAEDSPEIEDLKILCGKHHVALMGSLAIEEDGKYYNRVLFLDSGGIVARYDKQYLYSPSGENKVYSKRFESKLIEFKGWKILPQVCYDLRFPENVRHLQAPDLLVYMANWPLPRIHHWEALLKARAIENLCFTIGCNRIGKDGNDWDFPGHSLAILPNGLPMPSRGNEKYDAVSCSMKELVEYRKKYRFLEDKL